MLGKTVKVTLWHFAIRNKRLPTKIFFKVQEKALPISEDKLLFYV